ncbi:sodium/potassium/calcium exchanger 1-like isoform X4 [Oncorhynchus kisutch]|uniref:sodium/potassium/calcium exchanger 1-like isoform X4 n=1 Tax=Oncorhynchus kisutch TaxID=8019 RepID=UPI0012DC6B3D|nr:sodium/potassium/calcium exchanger 1-like isoform X4 [Oncorhynchus kisutch]XP_031672280.1 sodium/potassium/calcium exchanger 1-like isoform X4 [Oncorhynchus kisutch]
MHLPQRRRLNRSRILFFLSGVLLCCVYTVTFKARLQEPRVARQAAAEEHPGTALPEEGGGSDSSSVLEVDTREVVTSNLSSLTESYNDDVITRAPTVLEGDDVIVITVNRTDIKHCIYVEDPEPEPPTEPPPTSPPPNTTTSPGIPGDVPHRKGEYPEDLFTVDQRRQGWVTLHILGMVYMFVSLAIVCDEFFVPALGVITVKLDISDDVAGATFMAAGGSAPELFTSLIGVFISHSNVGIGTIVGSAVFNILFVIGMCAIFSREMLHLTWWPLFRDVSFYIIDLIMLIVFFLDNTIMWWESVMLVSGYVAYVCFMKFNVQIEHFVKMQINKHKSIVKIIMPEEEEEKEPKKVKPTLQRGGSNASLHNSTNRNTIFQLMIHTLDPLGEAGPEKTEQAEPSTSQTTPKEEEKPGPSETQTDQGPAGAGGSDGSDSGEEDESEEESEDEEDEDDEDEEDEEENKEEEEEEGEENEEPLSLEWPDTRRKQATYLFLLPIVFPLWLTVPDVRNPASRKYFAMTFIGSITWIAVFSYLMVWWAHQVGETIGISEEIMGLTILAAGTSIPDLITSVIVARKGLGDMAVSSSVGSNIFDITMGLPVPWLIFSAMQGGVPVAVNSNGLFCAIVLLFVMLLFVIVSIAACRWKMSRVLGLTMFMLYFVFLVLSVMLEDRIIICPVSI